MISRDISGTKGDSPIFPGIVLILIFAVLAVSSAWLAASFLPEKFSAVVALLVFLVAFACALSSSNLHLLPFAPRLLLILFALRPLLDALQSTQVGSRASTFSIQNAYAVVISVLLLQAWRTSEVGSYKLTEFPNFYLVVLFALSILACLHGNVSLGVNSFVRTAWGLLVALLLGYFFRTEKQIDLFMRAVFYSSIFVLLVLAFNVGEGDYIGNVWRLGGQFGVPATLAAVAFSLFAYGLYVLDAAKGGTERALTISLLVLLAVVILFSQSRTVGALLVCWVPVWLFIRGYRKTLVVVGAVVLIVAFASHATSGWRLTSSVEGGELSEDVVNLTGRTFLWAKMLQQYADANILHKFIGLGWGTVYENYASLNLEGISSVTESSFLWFLTGTGIIGLLAFCCYLSWMFYRSWLSVRHALTLFEKRLSLLCLMVVSAVLVEGATTDIVISPVASGYLYAVMSIFVAHSLELRNEYR